MDSCFTLIERLTGCSEEGAALDDARRLRIVKDSIRRDLENVFNAHRGQVQHLADYGLPELDESAFHSESARDLLAAAIRRTIKRYEPRLKNVNVLFDSVDPSRQELSFVIEGAVHLKREDSPLLLRSVWRTKGSMRIEEEDHA